LFSPLTDAARFSVIEHGALLVILGVAAVGLLYAAMLARQAKRADQGTPRMQEIAAAVREGANAYLGAQFRKIGPLILLLMGALFLTKMHDPSLAWGRAPSCTDWACMVWQ
jgi:K(+)-stimulated pyrophosphate-energized sodium pump